MNPSALAWRHHESHAAGLRSEKKPLIDIKLASSTPAQHSSTTTLSRKKNFSISTPAEKSVEKFSFSRSRPTLPPDNDLARRRKTSCRGIINQRPFHSNTNVKLFLPSNLWRDFFRFCALTQSLSRAFDYLLYGVSRFQLLITGNARIINNVKLLRS